MSELSDKMGDSPAQRAMDREPAPGDAEQMEANVKRPLAYITGNTMFAGLRINVDPSVLVPRRETELLVEVACQQPDGFRVHEVGTGSGAVALAIKSRRPDLDVTGSDLEEDALWVARHNAADLGLEVPMFQGYLIDVKELRSEMLDLVVANLPYLTRESAQSRSVTLAAEPEVAIYDHDEDGLGLIRALIEGLDNGQMVAVEHDTHHGPEVRAKLKNAVTLRDSLNSERVTVGTVWNLGATTA